VRRWTLLLAGAALWLFLTAIPALADGGPHVAANNSGTSTLTADGCAGCHRAHTAQGPMLLAEPDEEALCLSCHGASGAGAATNVELGVQYTAANDGTPLDNPVLGALRGGGFIEARIDSANPSRIGYNRTVTELSFRTKVSVRTTGQNVTSAHLKFVGATGVTATDKAWGNGDLNSGAGPTVDMGCATCHNPHGNSSYRILNPIPKLAATGNSFTDATTGVTVADAPNPANATRNYTVIQTMGGTGTLLASQVATLPSYANTMGDYLHRTVPWDPQVSYTTVDASKGLTANDAPNGFATTFNGQINSWCSSCHTRYLATGTTPYKVDSGDAIFKYRHSNTSNKPCTTCHVAHGSNAQMTGDFSKVFPYPDGTTAKSSRLLKIDNRGTCQACHDPTGTVLPGVPLGPAPAPYVP
jgi:predicted CXXCH cytochrome family protein